MKTRFVSILLVLLAPLLAGFDLDNAVVPKSEIRAGGPPKDGIPAILSPRFVSADQAGHLEADDMEIGVSIDGEARAYPIKILNWHEVVNDEVTGIPIAVTY